jgi:hypothetical protein
MWAGIVYGTLLERHGNHILLSGGAQICLDDAVQCDFPVGTYLKVTYAQISGRKVARGNLIHSTRWTPLPEGGCR